MHGIIKYVLMCALAFVFGAFAHAADYFVATTGADTNDGLTLETAFATVDKAITTATAADTIYVAAGTYQTTTQWGPNLLATMVGTGDSRDDVIIESEGSYRTLRTASTAVISNLTIVGNTAWKADKGGAVEMSGGTLDNCVIKSGTAYLKNNLAGGNIYMDKNAIVQNCDIIGGSATNRGGNVHIISGSLLNCAVKSGKTEGSGGIGGNLFVNGSSVVVSNCVVEGGSVDARGGNVFLLAGIFKDCEIKGGVVVSASDQYHGGGNLYIQAGTLSRCKITGGSITSGQERGGGIMLKGSSSIIIEDCLIANNTQGAIYVVDKLTEIYNTTIVDNTGYGIYGYGNYPKSFVNNILFGNKNSNGSREWAGNRDYDVIISLGTDDSGFSATSGYVAITEEAFKDYANSDYQLAAKSALIDAGQTDTRTNASQLDLNGNARIFVRVDIGCYECQKTVWFEVAEGQETHGKAPFSVTFKCVSVDAADNITYSFDFGDGSAVETTTEDEITHEYTTAGIFSVKMTAKDDVSEVVDEVKDYIRTVGDQLYVAIGNKSAAYPYNTAETAAASIASAYEDAEDGCEIIVGSGIYLSTAQLDVTKAVTIRSETGSPDDVIVRNTKTATKDTQFRCFQVNNVNAKIVGLTMENGSVTNNFGGCLRIAAGIVSNCVIRGGIVWTDGKDNAGGGGVELTESGIVSHCFITNNIVNGTGKESAYAGGAVIWPWNSKGRLDNALIAYNTYITSGSAVRGSAGLQFGGGNAGSVIENCTIVSNVVQGAISTESAGVWLNAWDVTLRNCVIAGNWQTASNAFSSVTLPAESYVYNCVVDVMPTTTSYRSGSTGFTLGDKAKMFKGFEGGDFTPVAGEVLANKGTTPTYTCAVDLAGNKRIFGKAIDIGCYEVQRLPGFLLMVR